jgi:hypothetical protein
MKRSLNILTKILNFCLLLLLVFVSINCNNDDKKPSDKNKTTEQNTKPEREEPRLVYDDRGNIIERHSKSYHKREGILKSIESYYYVYDNNDNVIEETKESYNPDMEIMYKNVNFYTYDDENQKIEQNFYSYDANDSLQRHAKTTLEYNDLGYSIREQTYYEDGSIKGVIIRDPDEKGALRSEEYIHYNPNGTKKDHKKYYYTEYGLEKTEDLMKK